MRVRSCCGGMDLWTQMMNADSSEGEISSQDEWTQLRLLNIQKSLCTPTLSRPGACVRLEGFIPLSLLSGPGSSLLLLIRKSDGHRLTLWCVYSVWS